MPSTAAIQKPGDSGNYNTASWGMKVSAIQGVESLLLPHRWVVSHCTHLRKSGIKGMQSDTEVIDA